MCTPLHYQIFKEEIFTLILSKIVLKISTLIWNKLPQPLKYEFFIGLRATIQLDAICQPLVRKKC